MTSLRLSAGLLSAMLVGTAQLACHSLHAAEADSLQIALAMHAIPDVRLTRNDGRKISLPRELDDGRPLFVNFIFTSCPGICPLMSESFRQLQIRLGEDRSRVHMVSISIDPEQDTPARLQEYADRFRAGSQWDHYTGTVEASLAVQRAFGVYNGDKMSHAPITFFRSAPGKPWVELKGFVTADDLLRVFRTPAVPLAANR